MDDDWPDVPVILGQGSLHDLSDHQEPAPRLAGMRSVSHAGAIGLHRAPKRPEPRKAGFVPHLVRGTNKPQVVGQFEFGAH